MKRASLMSMLSLPLAISIAAPIAEAQAQPPNTSQLSTATPASEPQAPHHRQVVTVRVSSTTATYGKLETWRWSTNKQRYVHVIKPARAFVGSDGVGRASEYVSRTPAGVFTLTETFGTRGNPGTKLPYKRVGYSSWWVSDVRSDYYNTLRTCSPGDSCGFSQELSEQLGAISLYRYAAVIDYNRDPVRAGAGSAFFLHVSEGKATQGCVAIREKKLTRLLRWLKPGAEPIISIGVGAAAYRPLR